MTPFEWKAFRTALLNSGHSLEEIAQEFGTPLMLFFEDEIRAEIRLLHEWSNQISNLTRPVRRLGQSASKTGPLIRMPNLLASLGAFPRKAMLALLQSNSVGFVLGNRNEILRCKNAGIDLRHCVYATPFKCATDSLEALLAGVGTLGIETFAEFTDLAAFENHLVELRMGKKNRLPISLCYSFAPFTVASQHSSGLHLATQQFLETAQACAASQNFVLRGASVAYDCQAANLGQREFFTKQLELVNRVALERQALNLDSLFLLIRLKFPTGATQQTKEHELKILKQIIEEILSENEQAVPLELKIHLAEGLCGYSSHILTQVLQVKNETAQDDSLYLDLSIGSCSARLGTNNDVDFNAALRKNNCPAYLVTSSRSRGPEKKHQLFAQSPLYNEPILLSQFQSNDVFRSGDLIFIPRTCAKETLELLWGPTGFQPVEILVGSERVTQVLRTRAAFGSELGAEV